MSEVKLYASAHADPAHIREFFEKNYFGKTRRRLLSSTASSMPLKTSAWVG